MITIKTVKDARLLKSFIRFPWSIYAGNPHWVPPLIADQYKLLDPKKSEYLSHSEAALFLAYDAAGKIAGRIAASKNNRHLEIYQDQVGFFGFFECIDDQAVANRLLDTACDWLARQGLTTVRGPMSFNINHHCGVLIDGFDHMPGVDMPYSAPWYPKLIENYGFAKSQDLYAYSINMAKLNADEKLHARSQRFLNPGIKVQFRPLNWTNIQEEAEKVSGIFCEAWSENWGAVPLSVREVEQIAKDAKLLANPDLCFAIEQDHQPIGVVIGLPDYNKVIQSLNGKTTLWGLIKLLWHKKRIRDARIVIFGIKKAFRNFETDVQILSHIRQQFTKNHYENVECSWVCESNHHLINFMKLIKADKPKTYRVYDKPLTRKG